MFDHVFLGALEARQKLGAIPNAAGAALLA
jgi:hypothetical protein